MLKYFLKKLRSDKGEAEWGIFIAVMVCAIGFTAATTMANYVGRSKKRLQEEKAELIAKELAANNPVYRGPHGYGALCKRSSLFKYLSGIDCV